MWIILGDLKLVEKPTPMTMAPHDFCNIKANVKVASTENGIIFGNIGKTSEKTLKKKDVHIYHKYFFFHVKIYHRV